MSFRLLRTASTFFLCFFLLVFFAESLPAQEPASGTTGQATVPTSGPTGGLTGIVSDPSGAGIPKASVRLTNPSGASYNATTNEEGIYQFKAVPAGVYTLKAVAPGFNFFTQENVQVTANQVQQVNVRLIIHIEEEKVQVTDEATKVDVDSANNAGQVVMKGKDLEALSDDPDELASELQALAGPSAGPNGGQIYIDGFTAGQLPPKASIREIRINQNPFSSEYDKLGYGRIEVLTKPGTDQLHGQFWVMGNTAAFNTKDPFEGAGPPPSYHSIYYEGNLGGALGKKTSFFTNIERRNQNDLSVVNTPYVDPTTLQFTQLAAAFPNPHTRTEVSQRFDFQVTPNNTLTTRYQYWRNNDMSSGVGVNGLTLPSVGYNGLNTEHTFQMTDTQVLGPRTINETRFQYIHQEVDQFPLSAKPTISIQGAFTTGGSSSGTSLDTQSRYELQNITYFNVGKHAIKYGGRLRAATEDYVSTSRFNGTYVFGSRPNPTVAGCNVPNPPSSCPQLNGLQAYQIMLQAIASGDTQANVATAIAKGGGASYYTLNSSATGNAIANVTWFDGALFVQDDWRIRPNITLSTGLRYETQNDLGDHADFAPRIGIAWGLGGNGKNRSPKTVLRGGFGLFYDRFGSGLVLQQELQNGLLQQQSQIQNPPFFDPDDTVPVQSNIHPQVVYQVNPALRTPYIMQTGLSVERQLGKYANLSVTYLNSRGVHQLYTNYVPILGVQPATPPITYEYESGGIFKQNQLIVNSRAQVGGNLTLWGYYTLNYANGDTSGAGYIPSVPCIPNVTAGGPCGIGEDYGRASFDVRHRVFVGGTMNMRWGIRLSPFVVAQSGSPFNITTGQDVYGINTFNARPTVGTCGNPGVVSTAYGCFNLAAQPGQMGIPINEETGPGRFTTNLRLSKTFGFGEKKETARKGGGPGGGGTFGRGPGGPHGEHGGGGMFGGSSENHYNLTLSVHAQNIFNKVNVVNPIGNLSSPYFGESNGLVGRPFSSPTANRTLYLQCTFNF